MWGSEIEEEGLGGLGVGVLGKGGGGDSIYFTFSPLSYSLKGYFHPLPNNLKGILYFVEEKHTHTVWERGICNQDRSTARQQHLEICVLGFPICV